MLTSPFSQGTPLFQSILVLYSVDLEPDEQPIPHDHLDDLESFFYILTYIIYTYDSQGASYPMDTLLKRWKSNTGMSAAGHKGFFLLRGKYVPDTIASRWPKALLDVFSGFGAFLSPLSQEKVSTRYMEPEEVPELLRLLRGMASNAEQHYDEILRIFDAGIEALEKIDNEDEALKVHPTDRVPSSVRPPSQGNPLKRAREEETDCQPATKRSNLSSQ
jgi:hypothetical protein